MTNVEPVKKAIDQIYRRRRAAVYALCLKWAAQSLNLFHMYQPQTPGFKGKYWTNRTGQAAARMRTRAIRYDDGASFKMQHGVMYGTYLELCNNREHESIGKIIADVYENFRNELLELYAS